MRRVALAAAATLALAAVLAGGAVASAPASADGVAVSTCKEARWCTVTAAGYVTPTASQLAIGNVRAGTPLAVTQISTNEHQIGGQVLRGSLVGVCVWSQYQRDWTAPSGSASAACVAPVLDTAQFVADGGRAIWSGCFPRCFGGIPIRYEARCGQGGRTFCYSHDCLEYANFYPWSASAHPDDSVRRVAHHHLDVRYLARYPDAVNGHPYYMVRDTDAYHGTGNWVFVSAQGCRIRVGRMGAYHTEPRHR